MHMMRDGTQKKARVAELLVYEGMALQSADQVMAGDIVVISGLENLKIGDTIADKDQPEALPIIAVEEPTVKLSFQCTFLLVPLKTVQKVPGNNLEAV